MDMSLQLVTVMTCVLSVGMVEICYFVLDVLKHFIQVGVGYCWKVLLLLEYSALLNMLPFGFKLKVAEAYIIK